jgi:putative ABC transport system permease protein
MKLLRTVLVAIRALLRNKLRSFLTILGVIIGVGAVIAMVAIGEGAKVRVQKAFEQMGTNMLVVRSGSTDRGGAHGGMGSQPTLTWDDLAAIRSQVPAIRLAAAQLTTTAQVMGEGANWNTSVQGVSPEYFEIRNYSVQLGSFFTQQDDDSGAKVAVIGPTVAENVFGAEVDPVGLTLRVKNVPFEVVGVTTSKGQSGFGGDQDDVVFVPVSTYRAKVQGGLQKYLAGSIVVGAVSSAATAEAQAQIEGLLRERHRLREEAENDFTVRNLQEIATARQEGTETMTRLLAGIALVSLLVGGIGIMNIMLVSVTERTREIGLRMAIGAKPRDILAQFLVEAVTLSVLGGLLGVGAGVGAARYLSSRFDWPLLVQFDVVFLAVGFSALVGIGFGMYPAHKASRLDPIQALRYE